MRFDWFPNTTLNSHKVFRLVAQLGSTFFTFSCNTSKNVIKISAMFLSYRNESINMLYKSIDWFLYQGNAGEDFTFFLSIES